MKHGTAGSRLGVQKRTPHLLLVVAVVMIVLRILSNRNALGGQVLPALAGARVAFQEGPGWQIGARFSPDGKYLAYVSRLFFARGTSVVEVPIIAGTPPSSGAPLQMPFLRLPYGFDVDRTGHRFVLVKDKGATATVTVEVMQRWVR